MNYNRPKKQKCNKCNYEFSLRGGNYTRHTNVCDGNYKPPGLKLTECRYCSLEFTEDDTNSFRANHTRWCEKNPKSKNCRNRLRDPEKSPRRFITGECRVMANEKIKLAWVRGCYDGAATKALKTRIANGNLYPSEETREKISKAARKSKHRRLRRNVINYNGIMLDSSWELALAKRLDYLNIKWDRPEPIEWLDKEGKLRNYFGDFILLDYNLILDPKNPYAIKVQEDKLKCLREQFDNIIIIDNLDECINFNIEKYI